MCLYLYEIRVVSLLFLCGIPVNVTTPQLRMSFQSKKSVIYPLKQVIQ